MKKFTVMLVVGIMSIALVACGKKEEEITTPETEVVEEIDTVEETDEAVTSEEETVQEDQAQETETTEDTVTEEPKEEEMPAEEAETSDNAEEATQEEGSTEAGYEDNFAVDNAATAEFAGKIKTAVATKDLEALADLAFYPLYVGFTDGSVSVTKREELIEQGAERIFTPELVESIEGADAENLSPSMAGFALSKDGRPNIIFGVVEGNLVIQGINY